jgi:hypothetical protein
MGCVLIVLMHGVSFMLGLIFAMKEIPIAVLCSGQIIHYGWCFRQY